MKYSAESVSVEWLKFFRVYDTILEVERALKVLNVTASPQVRLRIEREAKVMAKLTHSNIVRIIDLFAEDGIPCIVMELCSGSIAQWVYEHGPMPPRLAVEVLLQTYKDWSMHTKKVSFIETSNLKIYF